jgi:hypothetical protein
MKAAALQALQHVRTTLAYQLTPEAVSELLEPILNYVMESVHIAEPVIPDEVDIQRAQGFIRSLLEPMKDDDRLEAFSPYCKYCGCSNPSCQCMNDE